MENTIYNDIKKFYKFILENKIVFFIFLIIYLFFIIYVSSFKTNLLRTEVILKIEHINFENTHLNKIFEDIKKEHNYSEDEISEIQLIKNYVLDDYISSLNLKMIDLNELIKETKYNKYIKNNLKEIKNNNININNIEYISKDNNRDNHLFVYYMCSYFETDQKLMMYNSEIMKTFKKLINNKSSSENGKNLKSYVLRQLEENNIFIDKKFLNNLNTNFAYELDFDEKNFYKEKIINKKFIIYLILSFLFFSVSFIALKDIRSESK